MMLAGKVAVVTGGGRGLGRAICLTFAREGADLVVASNVSGENEAVADEIGSLGRKALPFAICPGIVNTDIMTGPEGNIAMLAQMLGLSRDEVWDQVYKPLILQERMLEPEEIAAMAVYLASDDARGITGQAVNVCGGMVMH